jgi:hypothetical protein
MKRPGLQYSWITVLLIIATACNNNSSATGNKPDTTTKKPVVIADTSTTTTPIVTENDILDTLNALSFVKQASMHIDSVTHHKHRMAFIIDTADNEYNVTADYNGDERFETYYIFSVDKKTRAIKVQDVISGDMLTPADFEKRQKDNH